MRSKLPLFEYIKSQIIKSKWEPKSQNKDKITKHNPTQSYRQLTAVRETVPASVACTSLRSPTTPGPPRTLSLCSASHLTASRTPLVRCQPPTARTHVSHTTQTIYPKGKASRPTNKTTCPLHSRSKPGLTAARVHTCPSWTTYKEACTRRMGSRVPGPKSKSVSTPYIKSHCIQI